MSMSVLGIGFLTDFFGAAIVAPLLFCALGGCCCQSYLQRVGLVTALGLFLALLGHVAYYNWMHFELSYTLVFVVDVVVGWFLAGLVIAAIVKPNPDTNPAT